MEIKFTKHAEEMLKERKIDRALVLETVQNPSWKDQSKMDVWSAFRKVGNRVLRVVVKTEETSYIVITMYFDRRLKNESSS